MSATTAPPPHSTLTPRGALRSAPPGGRPMRHLLSGAIAGVSGVTSFLLATLALLRLSG